jgi:hypothetical protein
VEVWGCSDGVSCAENTARLSRLSSMYNVLKRNKLCCTSVFLRLMLKLDTLIVVIADSFICTGRDD